jgi:hypothetical protein
MLEKGFPPVMKHPRKPGIGEAPTRGTEFRDVSAQEMMRPYAHCNPLTKRTTKVMLAVKNMQKAMAMIIPTFLSSLQTAHVREVRIP